MDAMDGFSTAVAVLQLAGTAVKTSIALYEIISTIKNAPKEILNLRNDLGALSTLLRNLEMALESPKAQRLVDQDETVRSMIGNLQTLIEGCQNGCLEVQGKLSSLSQVRRSPGAPSADSTERNTENDPFDYMVMSREGIDVRRSISWLFRRRGIFAAVHELQRTRHLLSDAMGGITLYVSNPRFGSPTIIVLSI